MSRPDCFIAGFYKCGTTSLYMILKEHKNVLVSDEKENFFFGDPRMFKKGINWYEKRYYGFEKTCAQDKVIEVNPGLSQIPGTAKRLSRYYRKETPIVLVVRNPVDFLYSHYRFDVRRAIFPLKEQRYVKNTNFSAGFDRYVNNYKNELKLYRHYFSRQIKEYKKFFTNVHIMFLEEMHLNPDAFCSEILDFFDLENNGDLNFNLRVNATDFIPRHIVLKKIHMRLKQYNQHWKNEEAGFVKNKLLTLSLNAEYALIAYIERHKIEDRSKMNVQTRQKLEHYFEGEKTMIEELTNRSLKDIWW